MKWWFWCGSKRVGVHSSPPIIMAGTLLCLNLNRKDSGMEDELNQLLISSNTPWKSKWRNACCCWYAADRALQSHASNSLIWNVKHSRAFKSWLQPVLKCLNFSWFWQDLYMWHQRQDFPWKHWKCVYWWEWKGGFLHPFPHERGGGWTTVEGNGARRKSYLGHFPFLPCLWFRTVVNVSNRRAGSQIWRLPYLHTGPGLFWSPVPLLCVREREQKQWESCARLPVCHTVWVFRGAMLRSDSSFGRQATRLCLVLCFIPSLAEESFCSCQELAHLIVILHSYGNFRSLGCFEVPAL